MKRLLLLVTMALAIGLHGCATQSVPKPEPVLKQTQPETSELQTQMSVSFSPGKSSLAAVKTQDGGEFWLLVPRASITEPAQVTIRAKRFDSASLSHNAIKAGLEVTGIDQRLTRKALLVYKAPENQASQERYAVYYLKPNGHLVLLPNQTVSQSEITADTYHFSGILVAALSSSEFAQRVDHPSAVSHGTNSVSEFIEQAQIELEHAQRAEQLGLDEIADLAMENARKSIESEINERLSESSSANPCEQSITEDLQLAQTAQVVGVDDAVIGSYFTRLSQQVEQCLRSGTLSIGYELIDPSNTSALTCAEPIPFIVLDDKRLIGGAKHTCVMYERWRNPDPTEGGTMIGDINVTENVSLEGNYDNLTLLFDPPVFSPIKGHIRFSREGPQATDVVMDIGFDETTVSADVFAEGGAPFFKVVRAVGPDAKPYRPTFPMSDGDIWQNIEFEDGVYFVTTWTLSLDKDDCEKEKIENQCERELAEMTKVCSTLEDWMVVSQIGVGSGPEITCATGDCSGAIEANQTRGNDPFTSISKTLDKQCDNTEPIVCNLECFGWSK